MQSTIHIESNTATNTSTDDQPSFVAEEPEHCLDCFRLIRPGQTCQLTIEHTVLCAECTLVEGIIRVKDDLTVAVGRDRLLIRRGKAQAEEDVSPAGSGI